MAVCLLAAKAEGCARHAPLASTLRLTSDQVTNEPPAGLKAGILRSYTVIVDQERLERVETAQWRQLLFALCFLHSIVSPRNAITPPQRAHEALPLERMRVAHYRPREQQPRLGGKERRDWSREKVTDEKTRRARMTPWPAFP